MNSSQCFDLVYLAKNNLPLPAYISKLFKGAHAKDTFALNMLIEECSTCLQTISDEIHNEYDIPYDGMKNEFLVSGIETLKMFMDKCDEEGFSKFLLFALKANMIHVHIRLDLGDWE